MKPVVVLLPGFNGDARQPILRRVAEAVGQDALFPGLPGGRPSVRFERELEHVRKAVPRRRSVIVVGRSFGGRVALRYAATFPVTGVVLLGFPVRPPGTQRPDDERALLEAGVPVLIVQGSVDEKGPLAVLRPLVEKNRRLKLEVLEGAGHSFGRHEARAIELTAAFICGLVSGSGRRSLVRRRA